MTAYRTEECVCGGAIIAPSLKDCRPFVQAHQRSLLHLQWRYRTGIATPALGGLDDPRRYWPTADDDPVDGVQGDIGASADDAEGAA